MGILNNILNNNSNIKNLKVKLNENEIFVRMRLNKLDPDNYPLATENLIKDLKYEQLEKLTNHVVKVNYINEKPFITVDGQIFEVEIPLESKKKLKFERKYKGKIFYCTCTLKYTREIDVLSLHDVKPLEIINAVELWKSFLNEKEKSILNNISITKRLLNRVDDIIRILGLNSETLLLREKFLLMARLLPLVEEKYVLMDFGPRERGKTTLYKKFDIHGKFFSNTGADTVINKSTGKLGDFFKTLYDVFMVDEIQNISDSEFWTFIQTYADGNNGDIILDQNNVIKATVSCVLLGNPYINVDYNKIFSDRINIFDKTPLLAKKGEAGGANISRLDALLYSGGCRKIGPENCLSKDTETFPLCVFKEALAELRKKEINVEEIVNFLKLPIITSSRAMFPVKKSFSGLIKICLPEICDNPEIFKSDFRVQEELKFLYYLALELRIPVDSMSDILSGKESDDYFRLYSNRFSSLFNNYGKEWYYTSHRIIKLECGRIIKEPIDTVGIKQNKDEAKILTLLNSKGINYWSQFDDITLQHDYQATFSGIISRLPEAFIQYSFIDIKENHGIIGTTVSSDGKNPALFDCMGNVIFIDEYTRPLLQNKNGEFLTFEQYGGFYSLVDMNGCSILRDTFGNVVGLDNLGKIIIPSVAKNSKYWNNGIYYNYLTGQFEDNLNDMSELCFYNIEIN